MSVVRAGIVVTGTEVLAGIIRDENGPWLRERLRGLGVELVARAWSWATGPTICAPRCEFLSRPAIW